MQVIVAHPLRITISKTGQRLSDEKGIKNKRKLQEPKVLPRLRIDVERMKNIMKKRGVRSDVYALIDQFEGPWREWLYATGRCDDVECAEASFVGFIMKKMSI